MQLVIIANLFPKKYFNTKGLLKLYMYLQKTTKLEYWYSHLTCYFLVRRDGGGGGVSITEVKQHPFYFAAPIPYIHTTFIIWNYVFKM